MIAPKDYEATKTAKKATKTFAWGTVLMALLMVIVDLVRTGQIPLSLEAWTSDWPLFAGVVMGAVGTALADFWKHGGGGDTGARGPDYRRLVLLTLIPAVALSGCVTPALASRQSGLELEFAERTPDGGTLDIQWQARGEASGDARVVYRGPAAEGEIPWSLDISGDGSVTSPQSLAVAQGYADLLRATPETVTELAGNLDQIIHLASSSDEPGTPGILSVLARGLLDRFMASWVP